MDVNKWGPWGTVKPRYEKFQVSRKIFCYEEVCLNIPLTFWILEMMYVYSNPSYFYVLEQFS